MIGIKPKVRCEALEVVIVECAPVFSILIVKQIVMIFPERILIGSAFASFCCSFRLRSKKGEMDISNTYFPGIYVGIFDLTPRVSGITPTVWSLEVAKFDQGDRRVRIAAKMPGLRNQVFHELRVTDCAGTVLGRLLPERYIRWCCLIV